MMTWIQAYHVQLRDGVFDIEMTFLLQFGNRSASFSTLYE